MSHSKASIKALFNGGILIALKDNASRHLATESKGSST